MGKDSIKVSDKYGVNPTLGQCFYCGDEDGTIGLMGKLKGDMEAPRKLVLTMDPCPSCKDWMSKGIILIEIVDGQTPTIDKLPERTGRFIVVTKDSIAAVFDDETTEQTLKHGWSFIDKAAVEQSGLGKLLEESGNEEVMQWVTEEN